MHLAGPKKIGVCELRKKGYEQAMKDFNLENEIKSIKGGMHEKDGISNIEKLIIEGCIPEAVFAVNDPVAIGAFKRLKEAEIKIPDQVGIIGFSNNPITEMIDPPLTTVDQPAFDMGKRAAELLIDQIEGNPISCSSKTLTLDTELIIRNSA